jgi:hypothetical protein
MTTCYQADSPIVPPGSSDYLNADDLHAELGEPTARWLLAMADHVGLDGSPVLPADRAADLLALEGGWAA